MSALHIDSYLEDGFKKVCDVRSDCWEQWYYENIDESLMFSPHRSWVYFIVVDNTIVKVGETGNPLGIPSSVLHYASDEVQPLTGSKSRFGRYRRGDTTDYEVRALLAEEAAEKQVSMWARKCEIIEHEVLVGGRKVKTYTSFHKDLELQYLDHIVSSTGCLPAANKSRK